MHQGSTNTFIFWCPFGTLASKFWWPESQIQWPEKNWHTSQYIIFCPRHWCQSSRCAASTEIHYQSMHYGHHAHGCWKDRTWCFSYPFWRSLYASYFAFLFLLSLSSVFVRFTARIKPNLLRLILMEVVARWSYRSHSKKQTNVHPGTRIAKRLDAANVTRKKLWRLLPHGLYVSRWFHDIESLPYIGRVYGFTASSLTNTMRLALNDHWTCSKITRSLVWDNAMMAVILTSVASARSSVPTEHPGKISSGPTTLFGVPGITGHTICRTLNHHLSCHSNCMDDLNHLYVRSQWFQDDGDNK